MRREALALMVVAVVAVAGVAVVVASYSQESARSTGATTESSTPVPTNCTTTFADGLSLESGSDRTTFLMRPGTISLLCVTYAVNTGALNDENVTVHFQGEVDITNVTYTNNTGGAAYSYSYAPAPGVTDTAEPSSFTFQKGSGMRSITVLYVINASRASAGFYSLGYTIDCPTLIPMAITDASQKVTAADFPGFFVSSGCIDQTPLSNPRVTGVASMNTTLLAP